MTTPLQGLIEFKTFLKLTLICNMRQHLGVFALKETDDSGNSM